MKHRGIYFYLLLLLALALAAGLIFILAPGAAPETPPVRLSEAPAPTISPSAAPEDAESNRAVEVRPDTVQTVVALLRRSDSYSRALSVQSFWTGGGAETEYEVWVRGDKTRVTVRDGSGVVKNILLRGAEKWIWYSDAAGVYTGPAHAGDADGYQTIPTYEDLLALPVEDVLDAGYTDYDGERVIFARYRSGPFDYETCCYVSVENGLLIGAETYDGEVLIYEMRSGPVEISTPDESVFTPPT